MVKKEITLHEVIELVDSIKIRARTDLADIYLKEVGRLSISAMDALNKSIKEKDTKMKGKYSFEERKLSIISILLSVFALEAYINKVGHDSLEDLWGVVERNSLISKWLTFPLILTGNTFDKSIQPFSDFKKIKRWRDQLVHYKKYEHEELVDHPSGVKVPAIYEIANADNAKLAFNVATNMIKELEKMLGGK